MTSENDGKGLVIRRTTEEDGNKIAVRFAPEIDRTMDLGEILHEGFIVEVLDVETTRNDKTEVTLRFQSPRHFLIDRIDKICKPRPKREIGKEEIISFKIKHRDDVKALDMGQLEDYLIGLREAESKLRGQVARMKQDKSIASERGYRHRNNDQHHRWLMINEELAIVTEQLDMVQRAYQSANAIKKFKLQQEQEQKRTAFQDQFIRLARERLSETEYETLKHEANALCERSDIP